MIGNDQTTGSEFDAWMGAGGPSVKAAGTVDDPAGSTEAGAASSAGKRKSTGKGVTALAGMARKPAVLIPVVLGMAVVGLVLVRGGGSDPTPTESQYAALAPASPESTPAALPEVDLTTYDQLAEPSGEAAAALDGPASDEPLTPAAVAAVDEAAAGTPEGTVEQEQEPEAQVAAEADSEPDPSRRKLELRVAALENDLERARQTREANLRVIRNLRAEVAKQEGQGSYSVVAVLNDGVVVRDGAGSERVYGLGSRIGE